MNLNFENKTIEKIEIDCEIVEDLEIKLSKSKFNIAFKSQGKTIKKEIKKIDDVIEPVVMDIEEPEVKEVEEPVVMDVVEEPEVKEVEEAVKLDIEEVEEPVVMDLGKLKEVLQQHIPKKNTLDAYVRTIQQVCTHFKMTDMNELFRTHEEDIISFIESKYNNNSTIKSMLCSVYKAYKVLNIESDLIDYYASKQTLIQEQIKDANKKTVEEGDAIIEHFKKHMEDLGKTIQDDIDLLNNWKVEAQLYCVLKIYLTYGVLRSSELIGCKITDTDDDKCDYINVQTKQIVINNHKNDLVKGKKVIDISTDKKLLAILRKGLGNYLITSKQGGLYESSSAFAKVFKKMSENTVYDLRRAVSSKCIACGDVNDIKRLEAVQGHDLNTVLQLYNVYSKKE